MPSPPSPPEIQTLGKYQIVGELGRGAMGVVYEGLDPILERRVALKTIRKDLLHAGDTSETQSMLQRFRREAQAAARLHHPNVVVVYDYAEEGDTVFIAMELVRGKELKDFFKQKHPFDLKAALEIMLQLLDGLGYSHQHNIVHRDIKPANIILLDDSGQLKITDFGVARIDSSELTQAGEIMGTPTHMAPEQLMGQPVDGRADLFSAGVIFYQLLTGERPFGGGSIMAVMHNVLSSEPPPPTRLNPALPPQCDAIVRKALAKKAEDRYQNAAAFAQELKALLQQAGSATAVVAAAPQRAAVPPAATPAPPAQAAEPAPPPVPRELLPEAPIPPRHDLPATLEGWVEFLTTQEMPIFSHTARRINQVMNAPSASAMELGRIIQQDPSLTAKLLKLGNSAYYNPSRQKLPNISRAVIILGVKTIYNLAIACSYVESASSGANTDDVNRQIAKSIHTAVQAKSFATLADDPYPEEIFVAALMNNFGRVAFWCYGKNACANIRRLTQAGMPDEDAERAVLGFTLRELDSALCKHWKLGGLIEECQAELTASTSDRAKLVFYSHQLVDHLEQGLDCEDVQDSLHHIAEIIQHSASALEPIVTDNAEQAVGVANQLGAGGAVARYIIKPAAGTAAADGKAARRSPFPTKLPKRGPAGTHPHAAGHLGHAQRKNRDQLPGRPRHGRHSENPAHGPGTAHPDQPATHGPAGKNLQRHRPQSQTQPAGIRHQPRKKPVFPSPAGKPRQLDRPPAGSAGAEAVHPENLGTNRPARMLPHADHRQPQSHRPVLRRPRLQPPAPGPGRLQRICRTGAASQYRLEFGDQAALTSQRFISLCGGGWPIRAAGRGRRLGSGPCGRAGRPGCPPGPVSGRRGRCGYPARRYCGPGFPVRRGSKTRAESGTTTFWIT